MDAARFQDPRRRMIPIRGEGEMAVLDFGDASRPVDVVFLHANGFNAMTYRSILGPLSATLRIIAPDLRGHGATTLPAVVSGQKGWDQFRDDTISLLDSLDGPPVTLAGHSLGGSTALLVADKRPGRVSNVVAFDPVVWTPFEHAMLHMPWGRAIAGHAPIVKMAERRRSVFDDRPAAFDGYRDRGAFRGWPETMLADYVSAAFHDTDEGKVSLICTPQWEASVYLAQRNDTWGALRRLTRPARIIRGDTRSTTHVKQLGRRYPNVSIETTPGDHFYPMRHPDVVRDAILDAAV
jgi:pimeloyl-ACP methyl ester carboxylesterase